MQGSSRMPSQTAIGQPAQARSRTRAQDVQGSHPAKRCKTRAAAAGRTDPRQIRARVRKSKGDPRVAKQSANRRTTSDSSDAKGGDGEKDKGDSGAGQSSKDSKGSPSPRVRISRARKRPQQSPDDKEIPSPRTRPQSPSNSNRESDSRGRGRRRSIGRRQRRAADKKPTSRAPAAPDRTRPPTKAPAAPTKPARAKRPTAPAAIARPTRPPASELRSGQRVGTSTALGGETASPATANHDERTTSKLVQPGGGQNQPGQSGARVRRTTRRRQAGDARSSDQTVEARRRRGRRSQSGIRPQGDRPGARASEGRAQTRTSPIPSC